jgi:hypothetical protein
LKRLKKEQKTTTQKLACFFFLKINVFEITLKAESEVFQVGKHAENCSKSSGKFCPEPKIHIIFKKKYPPKKVLFEGGYNYEMSCSAESLNMNIKQGQIVKFVRFQNLL